MFDKFRQRSEQFMKVAIYTRVSTDEQAKEGFSIGAQKERLRSFCASQPDWNIEKEYVEEGWSAKNIHRPQMQQMLKDLNKNKFDIVLVYRLDRLTRSVLDLYELLKVFDENNVSFKSATEVYDTSTAMGRLFITLVAALAQWERENLAERVKFGMEQMLEEGKRAGSKSNFGYRFDKDFNCEIIDEEATAVRLMYQMYLDGYGFRAIADKMDELGVKPIRSKSWNFNTIKAILINEIYIGNYQWSDYTKQNNHPPIVSVIDFKKVQKKLKDKRPNDFRRGKYVFTGLLKCGHCEEYPMNGYHEKRVDKLYYRCMNCLRQTPEDKIMEPVMDELEKLITSKEYFLSRFKDQPTQTETDFLEVKEELDKIAKQKSKLLDLYMDEDINMDKAEFKRKLHDLEEQEQELQMSIEDMNIEQESPEMKYERIKNFTDIKYTFPKFEMEEQKMILQSIFEKLVIYKEKKKGRGRILPTFDYYLK